MAAGVGLLALAATAAGWAILGERVSAAQERDERLCLKRVQPPVAVLAMLDVTDRLAAGSEQRFTSLMHRIRAELPRDGRLTMVPFDGNLGRSPAPSFDFCSPGTASEANELIEGPDRVQRDYESRFEQPLNEVANQLHDASTSPVSPITEQIRRVVSDPAIEWAGTRRELIVMTDGLENTPLSRVYTDGQIRLPDPPPDLLRGVTVRYVELVNPRHNHLQTDAVRAVWADWFRRAGADDVRMYASGFAPS